MSNHRVADIEFGTRFRGSRVQNKVLSIESYNETVSVYHEANNVTITGGTTTIIGRGRPQAHDTYPMPLPHPSHHAQWDQRAWSSYDGYTANREWQPPPAPPVFQRRQMTIGYAPSDGYPANIYEHGVEQLNHGSYSQVQGYSQAPMNTSGFIKDYIVEEPEGDDSPVRFPQPQIWTPIHGRPSHLLHSQSGPSMRHPPSIRPEPQHINTEPPRLPSYIDHNDVTVEDYDLEESEETAPESRRDNSRQWEKKPVYDKFRRGY